MPVIAWFNRMFSWQPPPQVVRDDVTAELEYRQKLVELNRATATMRRRRAPNLESLDRQVLESDALMRAALGSKS
jgi:hypothetical protein